MIKIQLSRYIGAYAPALLVCSFMFTFALLLGCHTRRIDPADEVAKESDRLYRAYLEGDRDQARRSLGETIRLIENANLQPWGQANSLIFTYSRLYVLEKRSGNDELAEAALLKTRYWYLRQHELGGDSLAQAASAVKLFTAEKCMEFVDIWDLDHTAGKGPKYVTVAKE